MSDFFFFFLRSRRRKKKYTNIDEKSRDKSRPTSRMARRIMRTKKLTVSHLSGFAVEKFELDAASLEKVDDSVDEQSV